MLSVFRSILNRGAIVLLVAGMAQSASAQNVIQTFFVPFPEDEVLQVLQTIDCFGCGAGGGIGDTMRSTISIVPSTTNTVVYWDHWEDGYESNILVPTQSTSKVWGDGNTNNGIPPNFAQDIVDAGDVITLLNDIPVPRNPSQIAFDGRDKFSVTRPVAVTRAMHATDPGEVLAGAAQAYDISQFGFTYRAPLGTNVVSRQDMFEYSAILVMSAQDNTVVDVDADNDGIFETTVLLDAGESIKVDNNLAGATIQGSRPLQVHLITGDPGSNYEMRWFTLFPSYQWDDSYWAAVGGRTNVAGSAVVKTEMFVFNPNTNAVNVHVEYSLQSGGIVTSVVPVAANNFSNLVTGTNSGIHVFTTNGQAIIPVHTVDGGDNGSTDNQAHDWGLGMLAEDTLTTIAIVGWGQGSGDTNQNGNPIWVTAVSNTTVYVDFDADPSTGPNTDPLGNRYDFSTNINTLGMGLIFDTNDNDQTGIRLYTLNGAPITAAWGQDGGTAGTGNPFLDMGTSILPFPAVITVKKATLFSDLNTNMTADPGERLLFAIEIENIGFAQANDVILFDAGASNTAYVTNTYAVNGVTNADDTVPPALTFFPLDESGANIGNLPVGGTALVTYVATIVDPYPTNAGCIANAIFLQSDQGGGQALNCTDVPRSGLFVTKTNDPTESVLVEPGSNITYTIVVANTGVVTETGVQVEDFLPTGVSYVPGSSIVIQPYAVSNNAYDQFSTINFTNNDGSMLWSSPWIEAGESDGPFAGSLQINGDGGVSPVHVYSLRVGGTGVNISRELNIGSYTGATLSFSYRRQGPDAGETVTIAASTNGGLNYTTLATYGNGTDAAYVDANFDLTSYISTNTRIRYLSTGLDGGEYVWFDDVEISVQGINVTNQGGTPDALASGYSIPAGTNLIVQFQVTVADPPTSTQVVNTACARSLESPISVCGRVTNRINARIGYTMTKTDSPNGTIDAGSNITYTITLVNTSDVEIVGLDLVDPLPDGVVYLTNSSIIVTIADLPPSTNNVRDEFGSVDYGNNDGSLSWLDDWVEDDPFGTVGPVGDYVGIAAGRLRMNYIWDEFIYRSVDLSSYTSATWSFDWETTGLEAGDPEEMEAMIATNDTGPFTTLATFTGTQSGSTNFDITAYISSNTTLRFEAPGNNWENNEIFYADDVDITVVSPGGIQTNTAFAGDPPNLLTNYTLNPGATVTVEFVVTVLDPATVLEVVNTACVTADELPDEMCDSVTNPVNGATAGFTISKTNDVGAGVAVDTNDLITYTITMINTGSISQTGVYLNDATPGGTTYSNGTSMVITYDPGSSTGSIRDVFDAAAYTNQDGSVNWIIDWTEVGEANGPGSGNIQVTTDGAEQYAMNVDGNGAASNAVYRFANLGGFTNATLSFGYRRDGLDGAGFDDVDVYVSGNGGASWTQLDNFTCACTDGSYIQTNYDITAYIATNTAIRFQASGNLENGDSVWFDDVNIDASGATPTPTFVTNTAGNPPGLLTNYTIDPGSTVTVTFVATVDNPATVTQVVNTACATSALQSIELCDGISNPIPDQTAGLIMQKTSDLSGLWGVGASNTYFITVINTGTTIQSGMTLTDVLPSDTYFVTNSTFIYLTIPATNDTLDLFESVAYINNDGSIDWNNAWTEQGDDGLPGFGDVQIRTDGTNRWLTLAKPSNGLYRRADTELATNAVLSFEFQRLNLDVAADAISIYASSNGGTDWVVLDTLTGPANDAAMVFTNYDITPYIATNTAIRFLTTSSAGFTGDDTVRVDNVQIEIAQNIITGSPPPSLFNGITLPGMDTVTVQFTTMLDTPISLSAITNVACVTSLVQTVDLCAEVTNPVASVDLGVTKMTSNSTVAVATQLFQWIIIVTNNGPTNTTGVTYQDIFPTQLIYASTVSTNVDWFASKGTYDTNSAIWNIGDMNVGDSEQLNLIVRFDDNTNNVGIPITNTMSLLTTDLPDTNENNNTDSAEITPLATLAMMGGVQAYTDGDEVVVAWETVSEVGTAGFYLERRADDGAFVRVTDRIVPGLLGSPRGGVYRVMDKSVLSGEMHTYRLVEVEVWGTRRVHGPYTLIVDGPAVHAVNPEAKARLLKRQVERRADKRAKKGAKKRKPPAFERVVREISADRMRRVSVRKQERDDESDWKKSLIGSLIKIPVSEDGLYYLEAQDLADVLGIPGWYMEKVIRAYALEMSVGGEQLRYVAAAGGSGLYFYGERQTTVFTDDNIYWLGWGKSPRMPYQNGGSPSPASDARTFVDAVHLEEDVFVNTALFADPEADFWTWDTLFAGFPGFDEKAYEVPLQGVATSGVAKVIVEVLGNNSTDYKDEHHVVVSVGGVDVGDGHFDDLDPYKLEVEFNQALLVEGTNEVVVKAISDPGVSFSFFAVDSVEIQYERHYEAVGNKLAFSANGNPIVTVGGFTDPFIFVMNVMDAANPKLLNATTLGGVAGDYDVSFVPASPTAEYLAFTVDAALVDLEPGATVPTELTMADNRADYIVIAPGELIEEAQRLVDRRASQGLESMGVELEEVYDAFNYGVASPRAIHEFLSYAYTYWDLPPRYVVLVGKGTYDYKDVTGLSDNLVPALLVSTPFGLFGSDSQLGDVVGNDGVPEIAVGRIPVLTEGELSGFINKLEAYEDDSGLGWANKVLLVADDADDGGDFKADSDLVGDIIPPGPVAVEKIYVDVQGPVASRNNVLNRMSTGVILLNYVGHGGMDRMADEELMNKSDVPGMSNAEKLPVVTAMTCIMGRYEVAGYDSLGEDLVVSPSGGAIAVWSPTGYSINSMARILNHGFVEGRFVDGETTLGELILQSLERFGDSSGPAYMLQIYNLLGDPATIIK